MSQHASLTPDRWRTFPRWQQLVMIANEMHRATRLQSGADAGSRRLAYERILRLVDLTVEVDTARGLRRELLRWRDLVATLYLGTVADPAAHAAALRALLLLHPTSARQIPHVSQ